MAKAKAAPTPVIKPSTPWTYWAVGGLWLIYAIVTLATPIAGNNAYHLSSSAIFALRLTIILPYLAIWLAAAYSYQKVARYARVIEGSKEGRAFKHLSWGLLTLLGSLILSTFLSTLRSTYGMDHSTWVPALTILVNLSYVLPYLAAFGLMYFAAQLLKPPSQVLGFSVARLLAWAVPLIALAYIWLEAIFHNTSRLTGTGSSYASYYLPDSLIVLLIVVPGLVTWVLGLLTALSLRNYKLTTQGVIYQAALSHLVRGVAGVILASVLLQMLLSLGSAKLLGLGLQAILGIIYLFVLLQTFGFLSIARGAKKLAKIEAV